MIQKKTVGQKIQEEIDDFDKKKLVLADGDDNKKDSGYLFSQKEIINAIDLAYNSEFKSGKYDSEGRRKTYLNKVRFYVDVDVMQIDIDQSNYVFTPSSIENIELAQLAKFDFKNYGRENNFGEVLNDLAYDFSKYGTCVLKKIKGGVRRVNLKKLLNTQNADSLQDAAENGGYVIEQHDLTRYQMKKYKDWHIDQLGIFEGEVRVYERYGLVSEADYKIFNGETADDEDWDDYNIVMTIACFDDKVTKKTKGKHGAIMFMEKVTKLPYEEVRFLKQDNRWLGLGTVEKLLENQLLTNFTLNLRKNGLEWAVKKMFKTNDEAVKRNLAREVKDGEVLLMSPNGEISEVETRTNNIQEFSSMESLVTENERSQTFSYEVTTGENLTSNTPFRLGVLLQNANRKYFSQKQEYFALFLKRSYFSQLVPTFMSDSKEMTSIIDWDTQGLDLLQSAWLQIRTTQILRDSFIVKKEPITEEEAKQQVLDEVKKKPVYAYKYRRDMYKKAGIAFDLNLDSESENVANDTATLSTLYTSMAGSGDPRAENLLRFIASKNGVPVSQVFGPSGTQPQPQQGQPQQPADLSQLTAPQQ